MTEAHPNPPAYWRHRRMHSYLALAGILALEGGVLADRVPVAMLPLAQTLAWVFATIIGLYFGGNAVVEGLAKVRRP